MSSIKRRIFLCLVGLLAGLAAWPAAETTLLFQADFPSYLVFSIFLGAVFGIFLGGFFGSGDGIIMSHRRSIITGVTRGMVIGALGGAAGFFIGQAALFITGEYLIHSMKKFNTVGMPISRAIGWAFLGLFIGMVDGVRSGSWNKIRIGMIGGISGGFAGGLALEYFRIAFPGTVFARLLGLLIFGLFIGLFYGFVEMRLSYGVLTLLNGRFKGREFLINQKKIRIGALEKNDIRLEGYHNISDNHALVSIKKDDVFIAKAGDGSILVNDDPVNEHMLKYEDVIKIGSAKLLYQYK
ncbi:MAG: phosphopeptide-binding protein [Spirochaetae bacterium HGW-Spirochaetae-1]|jgi:hypothetical protein|nr:MAG: phosphopeptide-binding protein [Spirochaetae bacterium HGW-Spirochaetae-1]